MTQPELNEAMVKEVIEVIWNRGELDRIPEFYAEDFVSHQPKEGFRWDPGHEGLRRLVSSTRARFPDYHENIEDAVASGDRVVLRLRNTGTTVGVDPKSFEVTDFMLVRIEDGKIAEQWGLIDRYGMSVQLGVIPSPQLAPMPE